MTGTRSTLIIVHVPKTAGTTFTRIAARQYPAGSVYKLDGSLTAGRRAIAGLADEAARKPRLFHGHVSYGLGSALDEEASYATMLRHPVERLASVYHFARRTPQWETGRIIRDHGLTLEDFVAGEHAAGFHNQQTRMLAGADDPYDVGTPNEDPRVLLDRFALAGLTERFDDTLMLCRRLLGWDDVLYARERVNRRKPKTAALLDASTRRKIEESNAADMALYEEAGRRLEQQLAAFSDLDAERQRFRRRNRTYALLAGVREAGARFGLWRGTDSTAVGVELATER